MPTSEQSSPPQNKRMIFRLLLVVVILMMSGFAAKYLLNTAPKAHKKQPTKKAALVQVATLEATTTQVSIAASGQIIAARQVSLQSQVAGQVVSIHSDFNIGYRVAHGAEVLRVDPVDYQLALAQRQAALVDAQYLLQLEQGQQQVAQQEWQLFQREQIKQDETDDTLVLRRPHLRKAQSAVAVAKAAVAKAQLDLERTVVRSPFTALVLEKSADLGSQLSVQSAIATLVAVDEFWIQLSVPLAALAWLEIPGVTGEQGSKVKIISGTADRGVRRYGTVLRLLADIEEQGRMARLLVSVADPLDFNQPTGQRSPLLLGEYVEVKILGRMLPVTFKVPRFAVHNGNQVWLAQQGQLQVRNVEIVWRDQDFLYISAAQHGGLSAGEQLIVSDLAAAVPNLPLRIEGAAATPKGGTQ